MIEKAWHTWVQIPALLEEVERLQFQLDGSGAEMAYKASDGIPKNIHDYPNLHKAILEVQKQREQELLNLMINKLKPCVIVPVHRDWIKPTRYQRTKPTVERWHLAIQTNVGCRFWHEGMDKSEGMHFALGYWYGPVPYWLQHTVYNSGKTERIHIVVDLDTPEPLGKYAEDA